MPLTKEKLRSFIKLCQRGCVEVPSLVEYFPEFSESEYVDAYDFYVAKGCHNLSEPISKVAVCKMINRALLEMKIDGISGIESKHIMIIGKVMKMSGGKLDPNYVKGITEEYLEVYYK